MNVISIGIAEGIDLFLKELHSNSPSAWHFTSRQPMSSGATCSAVRAKKAWGRRWESVVAKEVAWR
jgi:hypothetical protein